MLRIVCLLPRSALRFGVSNGLSRIDQFERVIGTMNQQALIVEGEGTQAITGLSASDVPRLIELHDAGPGGGVNCAIV